MRCEPQSRREVRFVPAFSGGEGAEIQTFVSRTTITGGTGTYSYKWISSNGGVFSVPAGTWSIGDPPITTKYLLTSATNATHRCARGK